MIKAASIGAALAAAVLLTALTPPEPSTDSATVKVVVGNGHGSGVHIGGGLYLTAAHVVGDEKLVRLKTDRGNEASAHVMWVAKAYDVALVSADTNLPAKPATLNCAEVYVGQRVTAAGNPLNLEFITSYGTVAAKSSHVPGWRSLATLDATIVMGMSGGPVFDEQGRVAGVTVAVQVAPLGFAGSLTRFGFMVPSSSICRLMGRTS